MKLWYHFADGRKVEEAIDYGSYSLARQAAERQFASSATAVAYLVADDKKRIVRTYLCTPSRFSQGGYKVEELSGYQPPTPPPIMFPGVWLEGRPEFPCDGIVRLSEAAYEHELNEADRKGYERGFKVGIRHRRPLEEYERLAAKDFRDRRPAEPAYLDGSVRAGVRGFTREQAMNHAQPDFTVDLGHNRR